MKVTPDRITDYKAPSAEEAAVASQAAKRPPVVNYPGEGFREMTKAQWAALPRGLLLLPHCARPYSPGAYRYRRTMDNNFRLVNVYITDMKITEIPQK
ncbi:hydrolase, partial [Enterobacter hormaechei subsp. steigerwaltii]|nr:hydrolase [Enterobacter hormaechei subsp. steigerwaltii]